jgi:hypothetical protein
MCGNDVQFDTSGADFIPAVLADYAVLSAFALFAVFEFPYVNLFCSCYLSCQCLLNPGHPVHQSPPAEPLQ